jgi:hypothetical protein
MSYYWIVLAPRRKEMSESWTHRQPWLNLGPTDNHVCVQSWLCNTTMVAHQFQISLSPIPSSIYRDQKHRQFCSSSFHFLFFYFFFGCRASVVPEAINSCFLCNLSVAYLQGNNESPNFSTVSFIIPNYLMI